MIFLLGLIRLSGIYVTWSEQCVLNRLSWNELFRLFAFAQGPVSFESFVEVVVDNQTHAHDALIINLSDHADQLGLELGQRAVHVAQSLALFTWGCVVNQLICEVDVTLD